MARRAFLLAVALLACAGSVAAQATSAAASGGSSPSTDSVPSWAIFDPNSYLSFGQSLSQQLATLRQSWGQQVSSAVSDLPFGILNLGTEAKQLVADMPSASDLGLNNQFAILSDNLQKTTCSPPVEIPSVEIPTQCVGAKLTYTISGGYCVIQSSNGPVTCKKPSITLNTKAAYCNLKYQTATVIKDAQCQFVKTFGASGSGTISGGDATTFNLQKVVPTDPLAAAPAPAAGGSAAAATTSGAAPTPTRRRPTRRPKRSA